MELKIQKRLAAEILKCSPKRVVFDNNRLDEIKESITRADLKSLIRDKAIIRKPIQGISRVRARKNILQKRKGRKKGAGSRKGKRTARLSKKEKRIKTIRIQRSFLKTLRDKNAIGKKAYQGLYRKSKGGFFRSKRHIKVYIEENKIK